MELITLIFLDKHQERVTAEEAETICYERGGWIMDAVTENKALQQHLREIIDRDTWLIEQQKKKTKG